jgi:hypothetical protein
MLNSTIRLASSRSDQLAYPGGGEERRIAITCASCLPSSNFGGGFLRLIPLSVCSKPRSTRC